MHGMGSTYARGQDGKRKLKSAPLYEGSPREDSPSVVDSRLFSQSDWKARASRDGLRGANGLAQLARDASLLAGGVSAECVPAAEAQRQRLLLRGVVEHDLGLEEALLGHCYAAGHLRHSKRFGRPAHNWGRGRLARSDGVDRGGMWSGVLMGGGVCRHRRVRRRWLRWGVFSLVAWRHRGEEGAGEV